MLRDYQNEIIRNVYLSWLLGNKRPCVVAPCGSGKTVIASAIAKQATSLGECVMFIVHRKEIRDQTEMTFRRYGVDMKLCIVGMVQTLVNKEMVSPDLIIMDENHHVYANSYIKILERFPDARVVGLTATPERMSDGGLGKINDDLIIGPSVSELIGLGHLAPFRYYSHVSADTSQLQVRRGEFVADEVNTLMGQKYIYGNTVEDYKKYGLCKTIVYCSSIGNSNDTAAVFRSAGISAVHVDGSTPKKKRNEKMEDFRTGRVKVLCNVELVSEGFDVPDCDSCILLRPTMSLTLHIQQSMRCMRPMPDKTAIILDMVENFKRHGLPDTLRAWSLEHYSDTENEIVTCENCSAVYDAQTRYCEQCGGWDMRQIKCKECGAEQQFGFGECTFCGYSLSIGRLSSWSRKERVELGGELQEIISFIFRDSSNYKIIEELRKVQKQKGHNLNWTYDAYKKLDI